MVRPRRKGRKDWPEHLLARERGGDTYYYWYDPIKKEEVPLKCKNDLKTAKSRARDCNDTVAEHIEETIITRVKSTGMPFSQWCDEYWELFLKRSMRPNTVRGRKCNVKYLKENLDCNIDAEDIIAKLSTVITDVYEQGKQRKAQALKSTAFDIFKTAMQVGKFPDSRQNPASIVSIGKVKIKRARLELDVFNQVIDNVEDQPVWKWNAFMMAIVTAMGSPVDMTMAQFKRRKDWDKMYLDYIEDNNKPFPYSYIEDDYFYMTRQKTGSMVKVPLDLRLNVLGVSIRDVFNRCKATGIASRHILHHTRKTTLSDLGEPLHPYAVTRAFTAEIRKLKLNWNGKESPTIYETRSTAERAYRDQGIDTQFLLMHKDKKMTDQYNDPRGLVWKEVSL